MSRERKNLNRDSAACAGQGATAIGKQDTTTEKTQGKKEDVGKDGPVEPKMR